MDDDKHDKNDDAASPPGGSRKRTPPTIDLTASSVSDSSAAPSDDGASAAPPSDSKPRKSWRDRFGAARAAFTPSFHGSSFSGVQAPKPARAALSSMLVAGFTGAVAALLVLGAYWFWDSSGGSSRILSRLPQTTARSDKDSPGTQVAKVEPRAPSAATNATPDPALDARLDALEKSVSLLRDDVTAARASVEALKAIPAPVPDTSAIDDRISKIERATVALTGEIAAPQKPAGDDPRLRSVAVATLLDTSVRQGEPYSTALASAKALGGDASSLKPLDIFATSGIPSVSGVSRELLALLPQLLPKAATPAPPSGVMDRLQQSASKLVRVQRSDGPVNPMSATIGQAKEAAQRNDIAAALRELNSLSVSDRAPVQAWMDKVDAREAALKASKQFALDMMTALSKPAPEAGK